MRLFNQRLTQICAVLFLLWNFCATAQDAYRDQQPPPPPHFIQLPIPCRTPLLHKRLTLKDAIVLALRNNPNVRVAELQRIIDKFQLEVQHNVYEPQYTFVANALFQEGDKPQYTLAPTVNLLTPTGATIQTSYNQTWVGGGGTGTTVTTVITQPLLRGFGPAVTMAPLLNAEYSEAIARMNLKNQVMTTVTQVIQSYYALVQAYNNLTVNELALESSLVTLNQLQLKIKAGQVAPMDLTQQQTQVANFRLAVVQSKNAIVQAYQTLLFTLGLDPNSNLSIDKNIDINEFKVPSIRQSTRLALANNTSYLQGVYGLKQSEIAVLLAQDQQKWLLNAVATKTFTTISGGGAIGGGGANSVQLNLNIPINDMPRRQQLVNAKVQLEQQRILLDQTKRQVQTQVLTFVQSLVFQQQQIVQAEAAVAYAQTALDVELKKLRFGRSTVFEVTQLRNDLTSAQLNLITQKITYVNTLAQFEQAVGITLEKWGIQLYY